VFCCGLSHSGADRKRERDALRREARRHIRFEAETAKFMEIMEKLAAAARLDRTDEDVAAIYEDGDIDGDMCTQKHVQKTSG
jgi:cytochrome c556